jgi:FkbM family methyltransferase
MIKFMRSLSRLQTISKCRRAIGLIPTLKIVLILLNQAVGFRYPKVWRVHPRTADHELTLRLLGSSDVGVFSSIFVHEELRPFQDLKDVSLVIDLGANVGLSAAYLLSCFPKARLIAVEPDERNLVLCKTNLAPYGDRATILHGAAWSRCTELALKIGSFGDGREWATQVVEGSAVNANVEAWDVGTLIDMAGAESVDLLKVDIEGAEREVFGPTCQKWLHRVRNLSIEFHGEECWLAFAEATPGFQYDKEDSRSLLICKNLRKAC